MKAANPGTVWQWQCDYCYRYFGPKAASESDLPTYSQMIADGWSVGRSHGDVCPSCLADGVEPTSERHAAQSSSPREVADDGPWEYGRRERSSGMVRPLRGVPLPDWWGESQAEWEHVRARPREWEPVPATTEGEKR